MSSWGDKYIKDASDETEKDNDRNTFDDLTYRGYRNYVTGMVILGLFLGIIDIIQFIRLLLMVFVS